MQGTANQSGKPIIENLAMLAAEQIVSRAFGIWGLYLLALAILGGAGLPVCLLAFFIAAVCSLASW